MPPSRPIPSPPSRSTPLRRWAVPLGTAAIHLLAATWRIRTEGWVPRNQRKPGIFCFWHQRMLPLLAHHRHESVRILISRHADGQLIADIAERFGFVPVRGSTTRGGGRALLELARQARTRHDIALTPDGPRGPRYRLQPGAIALARMTGRLLWPIAAACDRAWWFSSWDRFMLPKPFARIRIVYGEPYRVPREARSDEAMEACRAEFEARLWELTARTELAMRPPWVRRRLQLEDVLP